jgi:hypothetical protein
MTNAGDGVGLWSEQTNDGTQNTLLAIAVTSDGTWQEAEVLASGTDGFSNARVGVIGPQAAVAVWEAFRPTGVVGENRIFARTRNEAGWQEPRLLAEDAAWVLLAVSPTGHAVAAWRTPLDYMVDGDVVVAHYNHQQLAWGDALVLNEGMAGDTSSVHASINGNGQACLVWEQSVEDPGGYIIVHPRRLSRVITGVRCRSSAAVRCVHASRLDDLCKPDEVRKSEVSGDRGRQGRCEAARVVQVGTRVAFEHPHESPSENTCPHWAQCVTVGQHRRLT